MERTNESIPQSQRLTVPNPIKMPFVAVADRVVPRTVGTYLIVNERARAKHARRTPPSA
jgi:hypothetical protein